MVKYLFNYPVIRIGMKKKLQLIGDNRLGEYVASMKLDGIRTINL